MLIDFGFDLTGERPPNFVRGAVLTFLSGISDSLGFLLAFYALDQVIQGQADWALVGWMSVGMLAVTLISFVLSVVGSTDSFISTYGITASIRMSLINHLRKLPMGFWNDAKTGEVSNVMTDEFNLYEQIVTHSFSMGVATTAKPIGMTLIILFIDPWLGLIPLITLPLALMAIPWADRLLNAAADKTLPTKREMITRLVEYTQGIKTLREYGKASEFEARLQKVADEYEARQMTLEISIVPALLTYRVLTWLGFALIIAVGAYRVASGAMTPTLFLLVSMLSVSLFYSISEISVFVTLSRFAQRTLRDIRRLFEEAEQPTETESVALSDAGIALEDVQFAYRGTRMAIDGVSATLKPGTVTALVGPSGSGKSTLASLVPRLWDVTGGCVKIGGQDVRKLPLSQLRKQIAMVLQDVVLFEDTVAANIRLGQPEASDEAVIEAAKRAEAHDFIMALPEGYHTLLGEGGSGLSGGQLQRLSIARALLLNAPILVLDEATSNVDSHHELKIQRAIGELTRNRTVLVIAHRLWTVQNADQILVLDQGKIVERGQHTELLEKGGLYKTLWDTQNESRGWTLKPA